MRKFRSVLAVMAVAGIVVGACGDDEKSTDTTAGGSTETTAGGSTETTAGGGTEDAGLAAARANVEAHLTADGSIGVTIPLTAVPEKHTIAWMECDVPTCSAYLTPGFKAATEALGWDLQIFPMKSADPGPGIQAAIDTVLASSIGQSSHIPALRISLNSGGINRPMWFGDDARARRQARQRARMDRRLRIDLRLSHRWYARCGLESAMFSLIRKPVALTREGAVDLFVEHLQRFGIADRELCWRRCQRA